MEKRFPKEKTAFQCFLRKSNSSEQIYTDIVVKNNIFQRCCAMLKQNTKDQDKLKLNRYVLKIFKLFYNINGVE
jgi:hypothetical protein